MKKFDYKFKYFFAFVFLLISIIITFTVILSSKSSSTRSEKLLTTNVGKSAASIDIKAQLVNTSQGFASITERALPSVVDISTTQLIDRGRTKRGWLDIRIQRLAPETAKALSIKAQGIIVGETSHDSSAEKDSIQNKGIKTIYLEVYAWKTIFI